MNNKIISDENLIKLAVLIDADNAPASNIGFILAEIASYGEAIVKRIYGNFASSHSTQWKKILNKHAIKPVQQFAYTTGKNATDSALIIDAMDLLYTHRFHGFCIISSDSDFTCLANRIREEGLQVYGFGERKTPASFRNACNKFIFTEILLPKHSKQTISSDNAIKLNRASNGHQSPGGRKVFPKDFIIEALSNTYDDSGWAYIGNFGNYLIKLRPAFDSRLYGFKKLSDLIRGMPDLFETEERIHPKSKTSMIFLRAK